MTAFLCLIVIIGLFVINNNISNKFKHLEDTIDILSKRLKHLNHKLQDSENTVKVKKKKKKKATDIETSKSSTIKDTIGFSEEKAEEPIKKPLITPISTTESFSKSYDASRTIKPLDSVKKTIEEPIVPPTPKKSWFATFKENNPDLEKFIGENLINKIGILILVLGISFFVKYAIDKDWINEPARVGIGILCGALVMAIAHKLKKNFASFSSVLVAGAISIFYFTIYIAFNEYQLFGQTTAFAIMAVITAFSALVSLSYNRQELAVLSLIGGFAAPFMVSTGEGNYVVLFSYIAILNIGLLAISYFKKWRIAIVLAFVFTTVLFSFWCFTKFYNDFPHAGAMTFATIFYFIFSVTIVLNNIKNKGIFKPLDYFILIANTFFFFGIGLAILKSWDSKFTGLFTLALAIYNIVYASILYKKFGLDKNAIYLLLGLALTFITLTIPIQFEGNQITLFWACEAVLLLWLSQKSKIDTFKTGTLIIQVLTLISLLMDWSKYGNYNADYSIVFNPLCIAGIVVSLSFYLTYKLLQNETTFSTNFFKLKLSAYKSVIIITALIITYFTGLLEVNHQAFRLIDNYTSALAFPVTYHFTALSILVFLSYKFNGQLLRKALLIISGLSIFGYIVAFYALPKQEIADNLINGTQTSYAFYLHYIILACLIYFATIIFKQTAPVFNLQSKHTKWLLWVFVFAIVYTLSNEVMIHGLKLSNSIVTPTELAKQFTEDNASYSRTVFINDTIESLQTQIIKIGYPILWGVFAFVFLIIGIKKDWKMLRVIALSLLGITILKLFVYDIKNVSETGKIIAFILLGILVLVISFVYQKIKKLVTDETKNDESNENN